MSNPHLNAEQLALLTGPDARMNAYYYGFEPTGNPHIDMILSAVAYAGKGSHHTESWTSPIGFDYGPLPKGQTFEWLIQEAAFQAAHRLGLGDTK